MITQVGRFTRLLLMIRFLLLAVAIAPMALLPSTFACNCRATRAQRWLEYKAYKEKMAKEHNRSLAKQYRERREKPPAGER
jgi:hypothetical protein